MQIFAYVHGINQNVPSYIPNQAMPACYNTALDKRKYLLYSINTISTMIKAKDLSAFYLIL